MSKTTLLVVRWADPDYEKIMCELRSAPHLEVIGLGTLDGARGLAQRPDAVMLGVQAGDAVEQIRQARHAFENSKIMVVGYVPAVCAFEAARAGADMLLLKPVTGGAILAALERRIGVMPEQSGRLSLARAEWEYMHAVLSECHGNRSEAARRLGIHRFVLQRKLSRNPPAR